MTHDTNKAADPLTAAEAIAEQSRQARKREFLQLAVSLVDGRAPSAAEIASSLERLGRTAGELRETVGKIKRRDALLTRKKESDTSARKLEKAGAAIAKLEQERDRWVEQFEQEKLRPALLEAERHRQVVRSAPASMTRDLVETCCDSSLVARRAELRQRLREGEQRGLPGCHTNEQLRAALGVIAEELRLVEAAMREHDPRAAIDDTVQS